MQSRATARMRHGAIARSPRQRRRSWRPCAPRVPSYRSCVSHVSVGSPRGQLRTMGRIARFRVRCGVARRHFDGLIPNERGKIGITPHGTESRDDQGFRRNTVPFILGKAPDRQESRADPRFRRIDSMVNSGFPESIALDGSAGSSRNFSAAAGKPLFALRPAHRGTTGPPRAEQSLRGRPRPWRRGGRGWSPPWPGASRQRGSSCSCAADRRRSHRASGAPPPRRSTSP